MSYEGYEIGYCKNGHEVYIGDSYLSPVNLTCPVCGETEMVLDYIDYTNGCECDTDCYKKQGKRCPAHPTKLDLIKYDSIICKTCSGRGYTKVSTMFSTKKCFCDRNPSCSICFGTNCVYMPYIDTMSDILCDVCFGRGTSFVPVYDLTPLLKQQHDG